MAKFDIEVTVFMEQNRLYRDVSITKKEVVEELGLSGEDRQYWDDYISDYINQFGIEELIEEKGLELSDNYEITETLETQLDLRDVEVKGIGVKS